MAESPLRESASAGQYGADDERALADVVASQLLWRGNGPQWSPDIDAETTAASRFEDAFAAWLGLPYAHAVNSGTSANEAAVASLTLAPGSEVLCPTASPIFVPMAVLAAGCIPVFVDVDPSTMLIDPDRIDDAVSENTRAIVALHLWGLPAPIDAICEAARSHDLFVVEDCAQAPASFSRGRRLGTLGDVSCFSLQQSKLLSSGEGGVVATADRTRYARTVLYSNTGIPSLRHGITLDDLGITQRGIVSYGHNHRMGELQAAVALAQLERSDELVARRADAVGDLVEAIAELGEDGIRPLEPAPGSDVSYWRLPVHVPDGFGDYRGIPPVEPVFADMERFRRTPFRVPLPPYVHYDETIARGALEGAERIRVLAVDPFATRDGARRTVRARLTV